MNDETLKLIPDWLGAGVIGAVVAALGYVVKLIIDTWRNILDGKNARNARIVELNSLLVATRVSFIVQKKHRDNLSLSILKNHADIINPDDGYEEIFSNSFDEFTLEEKELHSIIRGITIYSIRPTNHALSQWLKNDTYFKAQKQTNSNLGILAEKLAQLEIHLLLWEAKYQLWIPDHPEHALVYLADEKEHGIGFPQGIDEVLSKICKLSAGPSPLVAMV